MPAKRWALAGLAAVLLTVGLGASAAAAQFWSAPADLGAGGETGDVAVAEDGAAVVGWLAGGGSVHAALRGASGGFAPSATLAPDGGQTVSVARDDAGGALVAWSRDGSLGLAERTAGAPALTEVATGVTGIRFGPDVAFTGPGRAIVVWAGTDGAVHALSRTLGGSTLALPDLAPGPGNLDAHIGAAAGHAVVAWTHEATAGPVTTTTVRASVMSPDGPFGPAEDIATATLDSTYYYYSRLVGSRPVVSATGAADILLTELIYYGVPGEVSVGGRASVRTSSGWVAAQSLGGGQPAGFAFDLGAGPAGDALYVESDRPASGSPTSFSARLRPAGAEAYGDAVVLHAGDVGEVRVAPLASGRFLVLMRSGSELRSRAGSPATGFRSPRVFSGTDGARLLGLAGAPSGIAAAAWVTTGDRVHAAIYGDPDADTTDPRLTRLSVSPTRLAVRRRSRTAARIRWRLSERSRVTLRIDRARPGFRRGRRCVARRPQAGRIQRCTRFTRVGSLTRTRNAGGSTVRFNGYVRRRPLQAGRHRLTAIPRDAAGNRGRAKRERFRVVRRRG